MDKISLEKIETRHNGGTKGYAMFTIKNHTTNKAFVCFKWGAVKSTGNFAVFKGDIEKVTEILESKKNAKSKRDYNLIVANEIFLSGSDQITKDSINFFGVQNFMNFGKSNLTFISDHFDVSGVSSPRVFQNESGVVVNEIGQATKESIETVRSRERKAYMEMMIQKNEDFGAF